MTVRLNLGCGRDIKPDWLNLDSRALPGVDLVADLDACREVPLPLPDDSVNELLLSHVIEHISDTLPLMQELHRIAAPGAALVVRVPYGSSDDAWEDPTHVRAYTLGSFSYFGQPFYWRADYGYRGDWLVETIDLVVDKRFAGQTAPAIMDAVQTQRNTVREMIATLRPVKPIRRPDPALHIAPKIRLTVHDA